MAHNWILDQPVVSTYTKHHPYPCKLNIAHILDHVSHPQVVGFSGMKFSQLVGDLHHSETICNKQFLRNYFFLDNHHRETPVWSMNELWPVYKPSEDVFARLWTLSRHIYSQDSCSSLPTFSGVVIVIQDKSKTCNSTCQRCRLDKLSPRQRK